MYLAGVSTFCTVTVLYVHHGHHQPRPVPRLLRRVILDVIANVLCMTNHSSTRSQSSQQDLPGVSTITPSPRRGNTGKNEHRLNDRSPGSDDDDVGRRIDHQRRIRDEWIEMARVIDRFCFVLFSIVILGMTSLVLILMAVKGPRHRIEPTSAASSDSNGQ